MNYRLTEGLTGASENFRARYSTDGGSSWTNIEELSGDNAEDSHSITLPAAADDNPEVRLRFRISGSDEADNASLDDVLVSGEEIDDTAPSIEDIENDPVYPATSEDVEICANVTDDLSGVSSVDLSWNNGDDSGNLSMSDPDGDDVYCRTLSAGTLEPVDGMTVTFSITAEDVDGNSAISAESEFAYDGAAPTADLGVGEPYSCDEGDTVTLDASDSDDTVDDALEFTWDLDGDGDYEVDSGTDSTVDFLCVDDTGGPFDVTVKVEDNVGNTDTATSEVDVDNVDPEVTAPADDSGEENTEISIGNVTFTDAGSDDTHTATVDWGDGDVEDLGTVTSPISGLSHTYTEEGDYTVTITITDDDGGEGDDTLEIEVINAVPIVTAPGDTGGDEGSEITIDDVTFKDYSTGDTHTATVDWGDGTVEDVDGGADVTSPISGLSHIYDDDGDYTVTITVTDSEGDSGDDSLTIDIDNVDPVVTAPEDEDAVVGEEVTIGDVTFTDAGSDDTHTATVDWGDGTVEDVDGGADVTSPLSGLSHTYDDDGVYTVTIDVTDDDSGEGSDTLIITVYNYGVDLSVGWNLISLPLVSADDNISIDEVISGISDSVISVWSYQEGTWYYYNVANATGTLDEMVPGYGYFIEMSEGDVLYQNGEKVYNFGESSFPPSVTLTPSWNLIGHYGLLEVNRDDALDTLGGSYSTVLDEDSLPVGSSADFFPEKGYWLFLTGTNSIDYAPSECSYGGDCPSDP